MARTKTLARKCDKWVEIGSDAHPEHPEHPPVDQEPIAAVGRKRSADKNVEELLQEVVEDD